MKLKHFIFKNFIYPFARFYWRTFHPRTHGVRGIVWRGDDVLLVKHAARDYWSLPGGGVGKKENTLMALHRELWEELRIPMKWITDRVKLGTYFSQREGKTDTIDIYILECTDTKFTRRYELDDAQWFNISHLPPDISPATQRRIDEYLSGERGFEKNW